MRISDWSSDVCSSDLPEIASTQSLRLDEAELLLVMALERLDLANDRAAAERAYVLAEAIFSDVANPRFVSLKQTLAQELAALRATPEDPRKRALAELDALDAPLDSLAVEPDTDANSPAQPRRLARKTVVKGQRVSVRVTLGVPSNITK